MPDTKLDTKKLRSLASDAQKLRGELNRINALEPELRAEEAQYVKKLESVHFSSLALASGGPPVIDEDTQVDLRDLDTIRQKLMLIPGARFRVQKALQASLQAVGEAVPAMQQELMTEAVNRREMCRIDLYQVLIPFCGGIAAKAARATDLALPLTSAERWVYVLRLLESSQDTIEIAENLANLADHFLSGKPYDKVEPRN